MNIYKESEKELAELLGWTNFCEWTEDRLLGVAPDKPDMVRVTEWCSDNDESFKLMVEHRVVICDEPHWDGIHGGRMEYKYDSLEHKMSSVRFEIVQEVIYKLKAYK